MKFNLFPGKSIFRTEVFTEKGPREMNEDSSIAVNFDRDCYYLGVADGMGGKAGGQIASRIVKHAIENCLKEGVGAIQEKNQKKILEHTFTIAQSSIAAEIATRPELKGMGTTLTSVLIMNGKYVWGNIGDSRMYLLTEGRIRLMTRDHSYIQDYLSSNKEELPAAILNRYKNLVTRIIDGGKDIPDIYPEAEYSVLKENDMFILCSDGLIPDKLLDQTRLFEDYARRYKTVHRMIRELILSALLNGSDDNITVVSGLKGELKVNPAEDVSRTIRILNKPINPI